MHYSNMDKKLNKYSTDVFVWFLFILPDFKVPFQKQILA